MKKKLLMIFWNLINTIKTFPVTHILAIILTFAVCIWVRHHDVFDQDLWKYYLSEWLALLFSVVWPLRFEKVQKTRNNKFINILLQFWAIFAWLIYYFIIHNVRLSNLSTSTARQYFGIFLIVIVWIFVLVALKYKDDEKTVIFSYKNIISSVIFGWIVWLIIRWWISGALRSIENLFNLNISENRYWYIWSISMIFITVSFCLDYYLLKNSHEQEAKKSQISKILWNYIFMPLALLYLVIFLAYWIKILITWIWPKWVIVRLGLWFFALWMLSIFFTYTEENNIFKSLHKVLFASFLLMSIMMICAISQRISQYWVTMNRYFVCAGIAVIILTSMFSLIFPKHRFLSFVWIILIIWIIWIYWWPLWASQISLKSQLNRLNLLLQEEKLQLPLTKNSLAWLQSTWINNLARTLEDFNRTYDQKDWMNWIIDASWAMYNSYNLTYDYLWYNYYNDYTNETRIDRDFYEDWQDKPVIDISNFSKIYPIWWWYYNIEYSDYDNKFEIQIWKEFINLDLTEYKDMIYDAIKGNYLEKAWSKYPFTLNIWDKTYVFTHIGLITSNNLNYTRITEIWWYILIK